MATLVLRNVKGTPLTSVEMDDNLSNLNNELVTSGSLDTGTNNLVLTRRDASTFTVNLNGVNADTVDGVHYAEIIDEAVALAIGLG